MIGALFRTMGPFAPPPPPGAQPPPLWGGEDHVRELFGDRVEWGTLERDNLEVTAFEHPREYADHFEGPRHGLMIVARANAVKNGQEAEFDEALNNFPGEWNLGTEDDARFEQEYLVAVGTRAERPGLGAVRSRRAVRAVAGLSRAHFAILSEPEMTSPSSVSSTGTMFWPLSSRTLRRVGLRASPRIPRP